MSVNTPHLLAKPPSWWKSATIYQIWPHSFLDTHGTGHGDLRGILSKLDYLLSLGADTLWLSPCYKSPLVDMGYDISDYESVDPRYGTMAEMDELIAKCHEKGMRVLLDLIVNHTSDKHMWFEESRKSRKGQFADFYIWKDAKVDAKTGERKPPNNWGSIFGGPAWEWVEARQQYYLHLFTKEQPDLNWEDERAREAVFESAMRFWLRKGIDGFRVDTCMIYAKDLSFPDGEVGGVFGKYGSWFPFVEMEPRLYDYWDEIRDRVLKEYGDVMIVGEGGGTEEKMLDFVGGGPGKRRMSMVFDFDLADVGLGHFSAHEAGPYSLIDVKKAIQKWQDLVMMRERQGWTTVFKENHDRARSVNRYGSKNPELRERSAKLLAMLMGTLSGTLFMYQGEEIGMTNIPYSWSQNDLQDVWAIDYLNRMRREHPHDKERLERAWRGIVDTGRDNARTPVQWSSEKNAGFTTGTPWMRVNDNYKEINVAKQIDDNTSVFGFWKKVLKLRKEHEDIFVHGDYRLVDDDSENLYTFEKESKDGKKALVILNFTETEYDTVLPKLGGKGWQLLYSNVEDWGKTLKPWEGKVFLAE